MKLRECSLPPSTDSARRPRMGGKGEVSTRPAPPSLEKTAMVPASSGNPIVHTVPWKSILPARFRSRTLTGVGANSTARLISSTQQWEYLSTEYFVYFRVGKCIHCELVNVSTQKFVKILAVYFNHHLYHIFLDIFDFLKAFNEFDITMFT